MKIFIQKLQAFWCNEEGLTTVEYAVAGGMITVAIVLGFIMLGTTVGSAIETLINRITL